MLTVNGKQYPMWSQFVEGKDKFVGGILEDFGDSMDRAILGDKGPMQTIITDITFEANGKESAMLSVEGEDFGCGFDVSSGGLTAGEEGWITFSGYGDHTWRIKGKEG